MLIDTHCHLDAAEFDADRAAVLDRAGRAGVRSIVIPAVCRGNFAAVQALARRVPGGAYALGIHPLYVDRAEESDLAVLDDCLDAARTDERLVAVGEIGLDHYVPRLNTPELQERQEFFYVRQLEIARHHGLPVLLHVRRSQDRLLKHLRRCPVAGGIAHAFNGSLQQAQQFIDLGFALGFGGAMTFERALQIRRLAAGLPATVHVLETDAPDIPPAWLAQGAAAASPRPRNEPAEVAGVARVLGQLRHRSAEATAAQCARNAFRVLPRLRSAAGTWEKVVSGLA